MQRQKIFLIKLLENIGYLPLDLINLILYPIRKLLKQPKLNPDSRFVFVISFPRSGTTALGSLLQQPTADVNYHGEFFALNHWSKRLWIVSMYYPFFAIRFFIGYLIQKRKWRYYQFEYLKLNSEKALSALATIPGTHVFKIFPYHIHDESLERAINKFKPDIMFLRRNHLDRLVSHKKAMVTGVWHGVSTDSVEIDLDPKQLETYVNDYQIFYKKMHEVATSNSLRILDVGYENLFQSETIKSVMSFLLADEKKAAAVNVKPRTLKQDSTGASQQAFLEKISNNGQKKELSDFNFHRINK